MRGGTDHETGSGRIAAKRISPKALFALEEALAVIYWYKADLEKFVRQVVDAPEVLARLSFDQAKRAVAGDLVGTLSANQHRYRDQIIDLMGQVAAFDDFRHLARLEDGARKSAEAAEAVARLRQLYEGHSELVAEREQLTARRMQMHHRLAEQGNLDRGLEDLRSRFLELQAQDAQARGYGLERLLRDLFALYDLDPKASFHALGEQVDGAFSFETTDYLLEARWRHALTDTADLDAFEGKIGRKLDNTLGLFVSINGFAPAAVTNQSRSRPRLILMDGADLWAVLEGRIPLPELLRRKRRHAAQTGDVHLPVKMMLS